MPYLYHKLQFIIFERINYSLFSQYFFPVKKLRQNQTCNTIFIQNAIIAILNLISEAATRVVLWKKIFLEISQQSLFFNFIKNETLVQVFSCEFCEISKNTFFTEHL